MSYYDFSNDRDRADDREGPYLRWNATCLDCGDRIEVRPLEIARCDRCLDERERWNMVYKARMAKASLPVGEASHIGAGGHESMPVIVDVAIVPVSIDIDRSVVEVALVPVGDDLKRMARAVFSADLTTIREVA